MFANIDNLAAQAHGSIPRTEPIKMLLSESNTFIQSNYNLNPQNINDFKDLITSTDGAFEAYLESLVEGMSERDAQFFKSTAKNIRSRMMWEMSTSGTLSPYQKLVFPLLRIYYPRLIAKELVTTYTMDTENVELRILAPYGVMPDGTRVRLPADIPGMNGIAIEETPTYHDLDNKVFAGNVKAIAGVPNTPGPVQKDFTLVKVSDTAGGGGTEVVLNVRPDIQGSFYVNVDFGGGKTDILTGNINWETGDLIIQSANDVVKSVMFKGTISYQGAGTKTPEIQFRNETVALRAVEKALRASWTIETEQDAKALLDVSYQSELLAVMAAQIAYSIDKEIINNLIDSVVAKHPSAIETFSATPTSSYYTIKDYYNTIGIFLDRVSQRIFADTNIAPGNVWAVNPNDAPIINAVNGYQLVGDITADSDFQSGAYQLGTINNKYKILISNVVPEGKMVSIMNTNNISQATYLYGVYQALYVVPRIATEGNMVAELKSRVAEKEVRPEGIGLINIA